MRDYLLHGLALLYGLAFLYIGIKHFIDPMVFVDIVPPYFPYPLFWVYLTGVMEVAIGGAVIYPKTRMYGGRSLLFFLPLIYLANIHMWLNDVPFRGYRMTQLEHLYRLLAQLALLVVAIVFARGNRAGDPTKIDSFPCEYWAPYSWRLGCATIDYLLSYGGWLECITS